MFDKKKLFLEPGPIHGAVKTWEILETIGPVFSNYGFKNWTLCLAKDAIIAVPKSFWIQIKTGLAAGLAIPGVSELLIEKIWAKPNDMDPRRALLDTGDPAWRRHLVTDLQHVACKTVITSANEILIHQKSKRPQVYGLGDRAQTEFCRDALRRIYGSLYTE
jgi:hypothetical protein